MDAVRRVLSSVPTRPTLIAIEPVTRGIDDLLAGLAEAADAAAEIVRLGKKRRETERPLRLADEALIDRLGDIATKLPDEVIKGTP